MPASSPPRSLVEGQKQLFSGTHRACSLEDTLRHVAPFLAEAGITRVADVTGLDVLGIPVVMVTRPEGRSLSVTQGKGASLLAARVSGIMEALEHAHAEHIALPLRYGSELELGASLRVLSTRGLPRRGGADLAHTPLLWVEGAAWADGAEIWLPLELVHLDYRLPLATGASLFAASSNGLASGNTRAEAVCHGLLELFERHQTHAFYRLDFAGQQALRLALHSVDDGLCRGWLDRIAAAGLRCAVWDLSDSLGVPCFLCDLLDARRDAMRSLPRARGVGCHLAKEVALARALSEAAQSRLTAIAGARDDISAPVHAALQQHPAFAEARAQMEDPSQGRTFAEVPSITHATFEEDLRALCQRLPAESANDVVVVALSPPGRPYCVVRVVVPGLRAPHPDVP